MQLAHVRGLKLNRTVHVLCHNVMQLTHVRGLKLVYGHELDETEIDATHTCAWIEIGLSAFVPVNAS